MQNDRLLMVHHLRTGAYDFWVAPGGGVSGAEALASAAERETAEETGLVVRAGPLAYIEDLVSSESRQCKFWYFAKVVGGTLAAPSREAQAEHIAEARFIERERLGEVRAFPPVVADEFWVHLGEGFAQPRYLGVRQVETVEFAI